MTTVNIPLSSLVSKGNIRELQDNDVQDIVSSFQEKGQEVPITVWETETGEYAIKFGHQRVRAASILGWPAIRAVVEEEPATVIDLFISQFIENARESRAYKRQRCSARERIAHGSWSETQ